MKKFVFLVFTIVSIVSYTQEKPKLVVGIVVDQMRQDYLSRYYDDFGEGGFKRLLNDGYSFLNAKYNYIPTKTGPGHASIFTGTTPSKHGIIGNDWYDRVLSRNVNCVEDTLWQPVGGISNGEVSPTNVTTTTVTDELRLFTNFKSKVIGVSLKDRGAVIPSGHNPTGAYWYDLQSGNMITSTYYMENLPQWVSNFNKEKRAEKLLNQKWEPILPISEYNESIEDANEFESELIKGMGSSFPYELAKRKKDFSLLKYTPFTNTLLTSFSISAIENEELGNNEVTDFLTLSYSATDDIGHRFGPRAVEVQDTYIRLDRELKRLFKYLDEKVGKDEYLVFLTADHGATDVPSYMKINKMPSGYHNNGFIKSLCNDAISSEFGEGRWIDQIINEQVYLNRELISSEADFKKIQNIVIDALLKEDYVTEAFTSHKVSARSFTDPYLIFLQNGYHNKRSGDVLYMLTSSHLNSGGYGRTGTDHRTAYLYDRHIPIIFYGTGIESGKTVRPVSITDIAPTISMLLEISLPSGATGEPLIELFENE